MFAFLLQAAVTVLAAADHPSAWWVEYDTTIPSAISYAVYHRPLGSIDSNVLAAYRDIVRAEGATPSAIRKAVEETGRGDVARGDVLPTTTDGIGAGQPVFMGIAFRLFGARLSSPLVLFLLLMGVSVLAFVVRFNDRTLFVALPVSMALSLISVSPMALDQGVVNGIPWGGNRLFATLGILPAIHVFFDILEGDAANRRRQLALAVVQVVLLAFTILVRSSAAYLLGLIAIGALAKMRATRTRRAERVRFYSRIGALAAIGLVFISFMLALVPGYVTAGRVFGNFWHRAFVSVSMHPDWPFGNLRRAYDCTKFIPEGLNREQWDRNGHCVWVAHAMKQGWSPAETEAKGVYGGEYEAVARNALFDVIRSYPGKALEVYTYYKPLLIFQTLRQSMDIDLRRSPARLVILVLIQALLFAGYVVYATVHGSREVTWRAAVILLLFPLSLPPLFVAWSSLQTSIDSIVYMYAAFATLLAFVLQFLLANALRLLARAAPDPLDPDLT